MAKAKADTLKKYLFVPDAHIPYHNERSWAVMMNAAADLQPYGINIIGDFADFYAVSDHLKDPRRMAKFDWEIEQVNTKLTELDLSGTRVSKEGCRRLKKSLPGLRIALDGEFVKEDPWAEGQK